MQRTNAAFASKISDRYDRKIKEERPHPSVLPVSMSVAQSAYAGAYMRSVNSRMDACVRARPVAGLYCSAVARLSPPSPSRGSRGIWTCVVSSSFPKMRRQSQPRGEGETETDDVVCGGVLLSGNASAGRMSAEMEVKGKYSGLGRPACEAVRWRQSTYDR